jgi:opacity protein-like surface antigen
MKKIVFAVVIAAVAASPAMAAKKAKKVAAAPQASSADPNENGRRFLRDSFPIFLPSWAMPVYMANSDKK